MNVKPLVLFKTAIRQEKISKDLFYPGCAFGLCTELMLAEDAPVFLKIDPAKYISVLQYQLQLHPE